MGEKKDMLQSLWVLYIHPKDNSMAWRGVNQRSEVLLTFQLPGGGTEGWGAMHPWDTTFKYFGFWMEEPSERGVWNILEDYSSRNKSACRFYNMQKRGTT